MIEPARVLKLSLPHERVTETAPLSKLLSSSKPELSQVSLGRISLYTLARPEGPPEVANFRTVEQTSARSGGSSRHKGSPYFPVNPGECQSTNGFCAEVMNAICTVQYLLTKKATEIGKKTLKRIS